MCVAVCGCTQSVIIRVVCLFRRRRRRNQSLFIGESIVNCEIVVDCKKCSQFFLQHPKCSTSPLGLIGRAHILAYSQSRLQIYDFFSSSQTNIALNAMTKPMWSFTRARAHTAVAHFLSGHFQANRFPCECVLYKQSRCMHAKQ